MPSPEPAPHWFEPIADHLGSAYLRYSFTKGTAQEVAFLVDELGLEPGMRLLDVGCGPGRHALALAERGIEVVGVDISQRFVDLATAAGVEGATFRRMNACDMPFAGEFDAAVSLCQGAFGLVGAGPDEQVLAGMARALRPGGRVAVSAFSSYFSVRYQTDASFDAAAATATETTEVRDEAGRPASVQLHTTCYTPRELRFLAERAGLAVDAVWSVEPGAYRRDEPTTETAEFLLTAHLP
jgi:SAM-dependent methyltransferase